MRIVITGGTGLIGTALATKLSSDNDEVVLLSRKPESVKHLPRQVRAVGWDGKTQGEWSKELEGADAVINLAGASIAGDNPLKMRWTPARKTEILNSRLDAGKVIGEAIRNAKNKPKVLIQAAAVGFYGPQAANEMREDAPAGRDFLAEVCREWEDSTKAVEAMTRRVVIRTGLVLSPEGGIFSFLKLPFMLFAGGPIGSGKQYMPWIHIDDLVNAILFLIEEKTAKGIFNLTAPELVTNTIFGQALGKSIKRPALIPVPGFVLKLALGEAATLALDGQRAVSDKLQRAGYGFKFGELGDALADLAKPMRRFTRSFEVPASKKAVSEFHHDTKVLKQLTPLPVIVQFKNVEKLAEGSVAEFVLWVGPIPVRWQATHEDVDPAEGFVDVQTEGPFLTWVHRHSFVAIDEKLTRVIDHLDIRLGKGLFNGLISWGMWVTLPILFAFRARQTKRLLSKS
mgnify:FL=1